MREERGATSDVSGEPTQCCDLGFCVSDGGGYPVFPAVEVCLAAGQRLLPELKRVPLRFDIKQFG